MDIMHMWISSCHVTYVAACNNPTLDGIIIGLLSSYIVCICRGEVLYEYICRMNVAAGFLQSHDWSAGTVLTHPMPRKHFSVSLMIFLLWEALVIAEIDFIDILMATYLAAIKALNCDLYITDSARFWQHLFRSIFIMREQLPPCFRPSCPEACGQELVSRRLPLSFLFSHGWGTPYNSFVVTQMKPCRRKKNSCRVLGQC